MLGSTGPATATIHTSTSSATPTSPTRPSRLRGLSYLRSYTHNHLHAHLSSSTGNNSGTSTPTLERHPSTPRLTRSSSSPTSAFHPQSHAETPTAAGERRTAETVGITEGENGWLPSVQGRSGLSRESLHPTSTTRESVSPDPPATMTRNRAATAVGPTAAAADMPGSGGEATTAGASASSTMPGASNSAGRSKDQMPTIRFIPHAEPPSSRSHHRPSLHFTAMSRTLKTPTSVVRVGRYSERDNTSPDPNTLPVGFKSKVVSRRHCELWYNSSQSQWYIRDVKSSSGTFLNHVRLSPPGQESRPYAVNDGDVVQLGIDFKGGEEIIFRCVKIRIECNRSWQKGLNKYNTSAHRKLLKHTSAGGGKKKSHETATDSTAGATGTTTTARDSDADAASVNTTSSTSECSICLNPVRPCQALFVAPCGHVWHYKCVRNLVHGPSYPHFLCPNCRFVADLEADVEPEEDEEDEEEEEEEEGREGFDEDEEGEWDPFVADDDDGRRGGREEGLVGGREENDRDGDLSDLQREEEVEETAIIDHHHHHHHHPDDDTHAEINDSSEPVPSAAAANAAAENAGLPNNPRTVPTSTAQIPDDELAGVQSPSSPPPSSSSHPNHQQPPPSASIAVPTPTGGHRPSSYFPSSSSTPGGAAGGSNELTTLGPMTPRNDVGPFVLDGGAGIRAQQFQEEQQQQLNGNDGVRGARSGEVERERERERVDGVVREVVVEEDEEEKEEEEEVKEDSRRGGGG
ncbi:hypothetical protein KC318_g12963 [Hortaea werneckii]|uniref:RING-type E3 ubiquitin transferase n=1 Tax=Hortaea werneckii TaxID=91943 RepID=A0A3M6Z553_HORWE|nr:hypothetical protein KC334_g10088 [Hortaea werneckii]KAI7002527.1 hypothetical protein KC355_g9758 [Hortaea werneckii]KAI7655494.1 hypothetical protein KC318_g12963 [Hortaea werneckii]RMX92824.1 hypothetical protein D0867_14432 [Hortaea werneckii]RMY10420.1 hypothetical protein D0866_14485 [Hortaea werneckii]